MKIHVQTQHYMQMKFDNRHSNKQIAWLDVSFNNLTLNKIIARQMVKELSKTFEQNPTLSIEKKVKIVLEHR